MNTILPSSALKHIQLPKASVANAIYFESISDGMFLLVSQILRFFVSEVLNDKRLPNTCPSSESVLKIFLSGRAPLCSMTRDLYDGGNVKPLLVSNSVIKFSSVNGSPYFHMISFIVFTPCINKLIIPNNTLYHLLNFHVIQ